MSPLKDSPGHLLIIYEAGGDGFPREVEIVHEDCPSEPVYDDDGQEMQYIGYLCAVEHLLMDMGFEAITPDPDTLPVGRYQLRVWVEHYPAIPGVRGPEAAWGLEVLNADGTEIEETRS